MSALFDEDCSYVNEDDIHSFAKALVWDDDDYLSTSSSPSLPKYSEVKQEAEAMDSLNSEKPTLIASASDWFPITGSKPKKKESLSTRDRFTNEFRHSSSYKLLRWPVLVFILIWVVILCVLYAIVRGYVALSEYLFTWRGERKVLRERLRNSKTYEEWVENAKALDKYLGLEEWSHNPKFSYYDYKTVQKTIHRIRVLRKKNDVSNLMVFLQGCLKKNFAGIENKQLYSHKYYGTKDLVHEYVDEVIRCIDCVTNASTQVVSAKKKRQFFKVVSKNYGKSALCLSGGACFAYTHFGIVKALLDNDVLPSIISGTSGGGLIAALACTRTDEELRQLLVPRLAKKITACEDPWYVWIPRFLRTGARFDAVSWASKSCYFTKGSTTFQEAYKATGRRLNISTVPAEPHSPVILCNSITSPNCIIWSSLLASSAVPGILNPVVLMTKDKNGEVVPFSLGNKWKDGSLRTDIPINALNTYYNVNFTIVSQVNPHISLFFFAPKGTVGRPVATPRRKTKKQKFASLRGGFIATALEQLFKLEIKKWLEIVKTLDLLPMWREQDWSNVWLQRFTGSITIWPRNRLKDYWYILSDPSEAQMEEYLLKGQRSMWPRLLFVKHRLGIERAIERGKKAALAEKQPQEATSLSPTDSNAVQSDDYSEGPAARDLLARANLSDRGDVESTDDEIRRNFASPFDIRYGKDDDDDDEPEDDVYSDEDLELHSDDSSEEAVEDIQKAHPKSNGTRRMRRSTLA
ncbi:hypothetical protein CJJ07_000728 [Candidozyma auris]|nr:hypothetical protein CJJ07_000728 [[Candida] auris]